MVVIVEQFAVSVEQLAHRSTFPSVDALRPPCCPLCGHPAHTAGEPLGIVGHGTYSRQVLGLGKDKSKGKVRKIRQLVILVRRFLCRACCRTISVLPDVLYPGRWYAGLVIVVSLFLRLLRGEPAEDIRKRFYGAEPATSGWRTLRRWQRQLLCPMWSWLARELGCEVVPADDREEQARRLLRMLTLHGVGPPRELDEVETVASTLVKNTAHDGAVGKLIGRASPL